MKGLVTASKIFILLEVPEGLRWLDFHFRYGCGREQILRKQYWRQGNHLGSHARRQGRKRTETKRWVKRMDENEGGQETLRR